MTAERHLEAKAKRRAPRIGLAASSEAATPKDEARDDTGRRGAAASGSAEKPRAVFANDSAKAVAKPTKTALTVEAKPKAGKPKKRAAAARVAEKTPAAANGFREAARMPRETPPPAGDSPSPWQERPGGGAHFRFQAHDFEILAENLAKLVDQGRKALAAAVGGIDPGEARSELASNVADAAKTLGAMTECWMAKPDQAAAAQAVLLSGLADIWRQTLRRFSGEDAPPIMPHDPSDKRFAAPEWQANPFFDWLRQSYALISRSAGEAVERTEGLDPQTRAKAAFYTRLIASALSPSNFVPTNPELLRATLDARGENLVRGMKMLTEDLSAGRGVLKIRQSDESKFELGVDMATTPGKVIWRNDVMELIQYAPMTKTVYARPLLIVPPWINKFYVLDLNVEKSFVRWAVSHGLTVFVISWVNPDEKQAQKGFDAYMREGVLAALDAIEAATGEDRVAAAGYCVGGTLLAATLAYMAQTGDRRVDSVTFLATQVDFTDAGDLQVFVDEARLAALDESMAKTGYLEGVKMATTFNMLRPNELIWSYFVNNYVKGVEPAAFDLLTWNSDCTRIPRANHSFYLRNCYLENNLARGQMVVDGVELNLRKVKIPVYELAAKEDHIAPARSVFTGAKFFGGDVRYVLAGAGHIAGVVNPPERGKYQYWTGGPPTGAFEAWVKSARETKGSWWPDWLAWLTAQAPKKVPAREPGGAKLAPLCDAPGEYVRVRA